MIDLPHDHPGPSPAKVRFFAEMGMAMQVMALYHSLPADAQKEMMEGVRQFTADIYNQPEESKNGKNPNRSS